MRIPFLSRSVSFLKHSSIVALIFSVLVVAATLPATGILNSISSNELLGVPFGYFYAIYLAPIALLFLVSIFIGIIEDVDRHNPDLENE